VQCYAAFRSRKGEILPHTLASQLAIILSLMNQHHHHMVDYSSTASELRTAVCQHEMIGIISRPL
jgi:hypothetical protein